MTAHPQSVVAVLGAGTMGAGIAQAAASAGVRVLLHDASASAGAAVRACEKIGAAQAELVTKGKVHAADPMRSWRISVRSQLCVPKTLSALISRRNHLTSVDHVRTVLFRPGRFGLAVQVEEPT